MRFPFRSNETELRSAIAAGDAEGLQLLLARHDFLRDDDRLNELVLLMEVYANYWGTLFDRPGFLKLLEGLAAASPYPEHRTIAANMVWDLTAMRNGAILPSLKLTDLNGDPVLLDELLQGPVLLMLSADWCTLCEQELSALELLYAEHGRTVRFITVSMEADVEALKRRLNAHPGRAWTWLIAGNDRSVMHDLRVKSVPAFFLLNDSTLARSPAPPPSQGLAAILHAITVKADEQQRIKPDRGRPSKP
jgi:thiol-disulfide isomerase/thioredoxin